MIETICPNCGNKKSFDDSYAGRSFRCPNCKEPVTIQSVVQMIKDETDSHEISFEAQIKKAEEEKKRNEEQQAYKAELKKLNDLYSGEKKLIWVLAALEVIFIIALIGALSGNGGELNFAGFLFFGVGPVVAIVLIQRERKKILQKIEDLKSDYLKKSAQK